MIRTILLGCLLMCCSACQIFGPEVATEGRLEVHLQASFENTPVQVVLNTEIIYDSVATTDHRVGLADVIEVSPTIGVHHLQVTVDEQYFLNTSITIGPELFLGVGFDSGEIHLVRSQEGFVYF